MTSLQDFFLRTQKMEVMTEMRQLRTENITESSRNQYLNTAVTLLLFLHNYVPNLSSESTELGDDGSLLEPYICPLTEEFKEFMMSVEGPTLHQPKK
jgi:hypothetical protein